MPEVVKLQSRKIRDYDQFTVTVPKDFVNKLGLKKGDILFVEIIKHKGKDAIVYYKP